MGRISKYYEENCLMQMAFVKDNKMSVEAVCGCHR